MYRGFTLDQFCDQCYGNTADRPESQHMGTHEPFLNVKNEKKDKLNLIEPVLNIIYYTVLLHKICEDNIIVVSISEGDRIETCFLTQYR